MPQSRRPLPFVRTCRGGDPPPLPLGTSPGTGAGWPPLLAYGLLVSSIAVLFGPTLWGCDRLAFRDCGHFYTPLYQHVAALERQQWFPLYNPLDVGGMPLAGETTTALFYPPRRAIYLLAASSEAALGWYVALHLLIAAVTVHYATATAGAGRWGRAIAILTYPLAGPILFLYCNPPFLVGAAWIPLAIAAGQRLLRGFEPRAVACAAIGLAMPILGGDPQVAIHAVLIGGAAALLVVGRAVRRPLAQPAAALCPTAAQPRVVRGLRPLAPLARLAAALALAILLAAPQLAASIDWASQSARYGPTNQRHAAETYDFSVAPWHWLELVAPALSGQLFPVYGRVSQLIPDDGRTWTITLYAGVIPLALALTRYRWPVRRRWDLWDALAPLGLAMALGQFGVGYLLKWLPLLAQFELADPAGGPYWWLATFLPGYSGFRYPAKWLVFVPLGIAVAAARQTKLRSARQRQRFARVSLGLAVISLVVSALVVAALHLLAAFWPERLDLADPFWGPLQWRSAATDLASSTAAVVAIAAAAFCVSRAAIRHRWRCGTLLGLVAIDLVIVGWPLVATIDRAAEQRWVAAARQAAAERENMGVPVRSEPLVANSGSAQPNPASASHRAMRFVPGSAWVTAWQTTPSPGAPRMLAVEASQRASRYGRWHLAENQGVFNPVTSLPPQRVQAFWRAANAAARSLDAAPGARYWDRILGWLALDQAWSVVTVPLPDTARRDAASPHAPSLALRVEATQSDAAMIRWHSHWRLIDPPPLLTAATVAARLQEITAAGPDPAAGPGAADAGPGADAGPLIERVGPPARHRAAIEPAPPPQQNVLGGDGEALQHTRGDGDAAAEAPRIDARRLSASEWRILVEAPASGMLCIKQFQDGNWQATVRQTGTAAEALRPGPAAARQQREQRGAAQPVTVHRCDFLFMAVPVPAGASEIALVYRPWWFTGSLLVAAAGMLTAGVLASRGPLRRGD